MNTVTITSAIKLTADQLEAIKSSLKLAATDKVDTVVDSHLIAGLAINVNGRAVDLSVKRQLAEIVRE